MDKKVVGALKASVKPNNDIDNMQYQIDILRKLVLLNIPKEIVDSYQFAYKKS